MTSPGSPGLPADLADRYGTRRPWRRRALVLASGALGAVFLGWLAWAAWFHATPQVDSSLVGFTVTGEHEATARIEVRLASDSVQASCLLRAYAEDHAVVGEARYVPGPGDLQTVQVSLRTERRATSVELLGCTAPGQPRPR